MREEAFVVRINGINIRGVTFVPDEPAKRPGLIISHGIPAEAHDPQDRGYPTLAERFCGEGFLTVIFNFRGCGFSDGNFDIRGWTRDLAGVTDYLWQRPELDRQRLSLMGFSAGAAVSVVQGAKDKRVGAVAACACPSFFEHFRDKRTTRGFLAKWRQIGIIRSKGFPRSLDDWMAGFDEVAPVRWVGRIAPRPLLVLHGRLDDLIPVEHALDLYRAAGEPKQIRVIEGAGHRLRPEEEAVRAALDWLKEVNVPGTGVRRGR